MADSVKVRIFGQEYSITGDKTPEEIERIASYVDEKMKLISKVAGGGSVSGVPALTCLNIAEEYFDLLSRMDRMRAEKEKAVNDSKQYLRAMDEAKDSYVKAKEQMEKMKSERQNEQTVRRDLEKKCAEYENSIFDLQMENIQLKSELEKMNQSSLTGKSSSDSDENKKK
ncbi:MAG: cell division protein ZapA [Eubacterium sp.]|jgi:cell division protein ZapA (FtsZ GTPase activity inhibitor)|nr:cell division protein ZapA [Eubacterium sp.]MCH4047533.1 cell division protein ZapA [Eubacterium sp.]MCH4078303.1 cell division protein ZapA [Eubacterium sp.]MCH4109450.1 cell division protein ZapA [Eubacterium sp.]MCI1307604.1 cell division protein ZapA [Eubacterium sp.]